MTRALSLLLVMLCAVSVAQAQRVHGRVVGIRGNTVQVRMSPDLDVKPGVRGTIYGNVRGRQGIIARIQSARKAGNVWTCEVTRTALRIQPGHTVAFSATVTPPPPAEPVAPPPPGTIVLDANVREALVTSGGVRMGRTAYSQRFSPRNATFYIQKPGYETERVVVDILAGETTRREVTLREVPRPVAPAPAPTPEARADTLGAEPAPAPETVQRLAPAPARVPPPGTPPPPEDDAALTVYVNQDDVDLVINGLPVLRIRGETQATVNVVPGTYDIAVYKGGYYAVAQQVTVGAKAEQALRFDLVEASAAISVNSVPTGARVKLSGVEIGTTPLIIPYAPGRFEVTVEADGYQTASDFVVAQPDEVAEFVVGLEPAVGWVFVGAPPEASVRIDGVFVGRGSQSLRLMAGEYNVEVRDAGQTVLERRVEVFAGGEESLSASGAVPPRRP
ncbi:PEGA domain-containing protein [Rubricoccus marinus]|uniref:PEGA domain-containing protein n=1 Tax=Rubricoccus marinus TaxID=716817 RepID=A0A259U167_9BACT|nr:PEGA domain-containing protein [Rubricoccus marinus]OZC03597.1 hypothetical protein BSZ36_11750 [Rubricoccus marinus]